MYKRLFIVIICMMAFCSCSNKNITSKPLNKNQISAKQIVEGVEPFINEVFADKKYHIGKIFMKLNKMHKGDVILTYAEDVEKGEPNVYEAKIDTKKGQIDYIKKLGRNSKINPGKIGFSDWKVDSTDALKITTSLFEDLEDFQYDSITIQSNNMYKEKHEIWIVELYSSTQKKKYWSEIDPVTGAVYDSGVSQ
ncbi:MAG TPA: hypothetical protein GXX36_07975 [Clostridiaceae bacterium]|nr:hypothetical protein [Clostridiaceae bacterium]